MNLSNCSLFLGKKFALTLAYAKIEGRIALTRVRNILGPMSLIVPFFMRSRTAEIREYFSPSVNTVYKHELPYRFYQFASFGLTKVLERAL